MDQKRETKVSFLDEKLSVEPSKGTLVTVSLILIEFQFLSHKINYLLGWMLNDKLVTFILTYFHNVYRCRLGWNGTDRAKNHDNERWTSIRV